MRVLLNASGAEWEGGCSVLEMPSQPGGKQQDIIRKFEKLFCSSGAQHGGKQKDIIRKFEK